MSEPSQPNDETTRERLVAYLDGELPDGECQAIESRLASDDSLRDQVQGLDRVWNALDELPHATVDDSFTKSTIEMAAIEAKRDVAAMTAALPVRRRRRVYAIAGVCAAALLAGFFFVRAAVTRQDRELVENLPIIYRVDALQQIEGAEFLRQLEKSVDSLLATVDGPEIEADLQTWAGLVEGGWEQRADWVETLSENEKARLLDAQRRYAQGLAPSRRESVDAVYTEIAAADDSESLMQTTLKYEAWLGTLSSSEQSRLRRLDPEERLDELQRIDRRVTMRNSRRLSPADAAALRAAVKELRGSPELERLPEVIQQRMNELIAAREDAEDNPSQQRNVSEIRRGVDKMRERFRKAPTFAIMFLSSVAVDRDLPWQLRMGAGPRFTEVQQQAVEDWRVVEQKLIDSLSEEAQQLLMRGDEDSRRRRLMSWVEQAGREALESIDLEEYFASDSLTDEERHKLLALPSEEMKKELQQLYIRRELGGFTNFSSMEGGRPQRGGWRGGQRRPGEDGMPPFMGRGPGSRGGPPDGRSGERRRPSGKPD